MTIKGLAYDPLSNVVITGVGANQSRGYLGFFGNLKGAEVKNLIIDASCTVEGAMICGGVTGNAQALTVISNCENHATIKSYGNMAGGIAGQFNPTSVANSGKISDCLNTGTIWCNKEGAGGIVGNCKYSEISGCVNTGSVKAFNFDPCQSSNSQSYAGGISGNNGGATILTNCVNYGDVYVEKQYAGGIMAYSYLTASTGSLTNCINTGNVSGRYHQDGSILGRTYSSASLQIPPFDNCYYDNQLNNASFQAPSDCSTIGYEGKATAMTTAELTNGTLPKGLDASVWTATKGYYPMLTKFKDNPIVKAAAATYLLLPEGQNANHITGTATFSSTMTNGSASVAEETPASLFKITSNSVAFADPNVVATGYITLKNGEFSRLVTLTTFPINFKGSGTEADPYQIATASDLETLAKTCGEDARWHWDNTSFKMTSDIDMSSIKDFKGIAGGSCTFANSVPGDLYVFRGNLDGDGHKISNMTLNTVVYDENGEPSNWTKGSYNYTGFFCTVGGNAVIKNLTIDNTCKIIGSGTTGGLIGYQAEEGTVKILNCEIGADVKGGSMSGGIFGYGHNSKYTAVTELRNCVFSGILRSNQANIGGIVSTADGKGSIVANCANAGAVIIEKLTGSAPFTISNCAGISGQGIDTIYNCVNYGPFIVNVRGLTDEEKEMDKQPVITLERLAGIAGMASSSTTSGTMLRNINVGQVSVKGGTKLGIVGSIVGNVYHKANFDQLLGFNYADTTLLVVDSLYGGTNATLEADSAFYVNLPKAFIQSTTADLTSGKALEGLENDYVFEKGYYPIPKGLENNKSVRAAAATFFTIPDGESVRGISSTTFCPFNTAMELKGELESDLAFIIERGGIQAIASEKDLTDMLTLRNGNFYNIYPLVKYAGPGLVGIEEIAAETGVEISDVVYYNLQGQVVAEAEEGAVTIALITFVDGTKKVVKIVK